MKFYLSGIHSTNDTRLLVSAGAKSVMVASRHVQFVQPGQFEEIWLDLDAYWHFKHGGQIDVELYLETAVTASNRLPIVRVTATDVIGDAGQTLKNWRLVQKWLHQSSISLNLVPVWGWDAPLSHPSYCTITHSKNA